MLIWPFIALALLLLLPVLLIMFALAIIVQRTSQAAYLRTIDNREKQLAYVVQGVMTSNVELGVKISNMQSTFDRQASELKQIIQTLLPPGQSPLLSDVPADRSGGAGDAR